MKQSLTDNIINITSVLKQQNNEMNTVLRNIRKSKSMEILKVETKCNPESKFIKKGYSYMNQAKEKKSKSFKRCKSCQFIDSQDKV